MPETVSSTVDHIRTELRKVIVGQDADRQDAIANHQRELQPHSVYARPDAVRYNRHQRLQYRDVEF